MTSSLWQGTLPEETEQFFFSDLGKLPVDASDISRGTTRCYQEFWSKPSDYVADEELKPYFIRRTALTARQTEDASRGDACYHSTLINEQADARIIWIAFMYCRYEIYCSKLHLKE